MPIFLEHREWSQSPPGKPDFGLVSCKIWELLKAGDKNPFIPQELQPEAAPDLAPIRKSPWNAGKVPPNPAGFLGFGWFCATFPVQEADPGGNCGLCPQSCSRNWLFALFNPKLKNRRNSCKYLNERVGTRKILLFFLGCWAIPNFLCSSGCSGSKQDPRKKKGWKSEQIPKLRVHISSKLPLNPPLSHRDFGGWREDSWDAARE